MRTGPLTYQAAWDTLRFRGITALLILALAILITVISSKKTSPDLIDTEANRIASACQKSEFYKNCYEQQLTKLTKKNNLFFSHSFYLFVYFKFKLYIIV